MGWSDCCEESGEAIMELDLGSELRSKDISDSLLRSFRSRLE